MTSALHETGKEYTQDIIFGIAYLFIAILAGWRLLIYFDPDGGGKVITAFYFLIFGTSFLRSLWFFIPKIVLEGNYVPLPTYAFQTPGWIGFFISEAMLSIGSLCLYAVFILIICYWAHMLRKVENTPTSNQNQLVASQRSLARYPMAQKPKRGPMQSFTFIILFLVFIEIINMTLYLTNVYNSEVAILYNSLMMSVISIVTLIEVTMFSHRIRVVLMKIGVINANSTTPQVRRILAMTVAANMFFISRVVIEVLFSLLLIHLWRFNHSFNVVLSNKNWDLYINVKHWSEIVVLALELIIATAIKSSASGSSSTTAVTNRFRRKEYVKISERPPLDFEGTQMTVIA